MEVANPLNLPEIVTTIGRYLPLWKQGFRLGFYDFNPTTLLSCCRVNKTWREALTPVIWYVFNGSVMRFVPRTVIVKNSRHFRVFLSDRSFSGPFESRHLKELVISWWDQDLLSLVDVNAHSLSSLSWTGLPTPSPMHSVTLPKLDCSLFLRMVSNLQDLSLSHWAIPIMDFVHFVQKCQCLTSLHLTAIRWINSHSDPDLQPVVNQHTRHSFWQDDTTEGTKAVLKTLRLDVSVSNQRALADFVAGCGPNLESLVLLSECAEDIRSLTPILREFCPKLFSIEYVSRFSSALGGHDNLSDKDYVNMVNCCRSGLRSITVDIPRLEIGLTKALIYQSSTLETLGLHFYDQQSPTAPTRNVDSLRMILQCCLRLRHLSLEFTPYPLANEEMVQLFIQPWACINLETLVLEDVTMTASDQGPRLTSVRETENALHHLLPTASTQSLQVRELSAIGIDGGRIEWQHSTFPSPCLSARQLVFDQARRLKKLHKLSLNQVTYALANLASPPLPPPKAKRLSR